MNGRVDADVVGGKRVADKPNTIRNIYCARALRDFGDGFVAVCCRSI